MENKELALVDALITLLKNLDIGGGSKFVTVAEGIDNLSIGYPYVNVVPLGPVFRTEVLGSQGIARKARYVAVNLEVHHEHFDKVAGLREMSDILWTVATALLEQPRLAGCESFEVGEIDYAFFQDDKNDDEEPTLTEDNNIPDWGYKGTAIIPIVALWRYR